MASAPGGAVIACGALQRLGPDTAEVKRMYVLPAARGRGHARDVLAAIAQRARDAGYVRLRLETGLAYDAAVTLYRSSGYTATPTYGEYIGNPYSICFEKILN